ncbi:MAG: flavin reductase family protein [Alphaproteobacteria bacterium]|nr:flavin reductase family protein [Alphaproteobacteria bacterium]
MPVDANDFRNAMGRFAAGVTVLTCRTADGADHGMTASAVCSVSKDPPLLLVCVTKGNATDQVLQTAHGFALNILARDQVDLSNRFAGWGVDPAADRFAGLALDRAPHTGAAWLPGAVCRIDCAVHGVLDGGDHHIYLGRLEAVDAPGDRTDQDPLLYFAGAYRAVGDTL